MESEMYVRYSNTYKGLFFSTVFVFFIISIKF